MKLIETYNGSGFYAQYASSADYDSLGNPLSSYMIESKFGFNNNLITGYNGSGFAGESVGGAGGNYVPLNAVECTIGSGNSSENCSFAQGIGNSAIQYSLAQGTSNFSYNKSVSFGSNNSAFTNSFVLGDKNNSDNNSLVLGSYTSAAYNSVAFGSRLTANGYSFNFGDYNLAEKYSQTFGYGLKATNYATAYGNDSDEVILGSFVIGEFNKTSAAPFVIGNGTSDNGRSDLFVVDKDGNVSAQGHIYAEGGVLGASLDTLELAPDNETIVFETTSSHNVENSEGEPEEYTVIKIAPSLLEKINKLEKLVSANSGNSQWVLPQ